PAVIEGDPLQIQNVFHNLIANARDAMPKGGLLQVKTEVVYLDEKKWRPYSYKVAAGQYVKVTITDSGVGMSDQVLKHIFEPFFTTKELGKGTGMGLASVYGTIKNHGGVVEVNSKANQGTSFEVFLPLLPYIEKKMSSPSDAQLISHHSLQTTAQRILIVDDEESDRTTAAEALSHNGYTVFTCADSRTAVHCYAQTCRSIDLVILDMVVPGFGGRDTYLSLRKVNPSVKVVVCSQKAHSSADEELLQTGVRCLLRKPFSIDELVTTVAEVLQK
ncbi:MAG: response regulator, partial [Chitinivibrionales bacterium]|nr:response regulator [Chitinivibrionales bacterium]